VNDGISATPETLADGPDRVSHVWRIVLIVLSVQVVLVLLGTVAFSLGLADQPSCGGG
jgi:anti-sigma-K factor RskA